MSQPSSPRATTHLSDSVHQHLNMYTRAATAAGVGIMALASPAQAKVVYTPANIPIAPNAGLVELDLNNDGINDFGLSNVYKGTQGNWSRAVTAGPAQQRNRIWNVRTLSRTYERWRTCAAAVQSGSAIEPSSPFNVKKGHANLFMAWHWGKQVGQNSFRTNYGGPWYYYKLKEQAYLGLKFKIQGHVHFGWARVQMPQSFGDGTAYITGYAYETVRNKPIIAGKTSGPDVITRKPVGLGHLARGAAVIQPVSPTN